MAPFGAMLEKIKLLLILASGHTARETCIYFCQKPIFLIYFLTKKSVSKKFIKNEVHSFAAELAFATQTKVGNLIRAPL